MSSYADSPEAKLARREHGLNQHYITNKAMPTGYDDYGNPQRQNEYTQDNRTTLKDQLGRDPNDSLPIKPGSISYQNQPHILNNQAVPESMPLDTTQKRNYTYVGSSPDQQMKDVYASSHLSGIGRPPALKKLA